MRIVLAIPALGLLAGCALGLLFADAAVGLADAADTSLVATRVSADALGSVLVVLLIVSAFTAVWALRGRRTRLLIATILASFACGGVMLAIHAWRAAWRSSLRIAFESIARDQRAEAVRSGRPPPEDDRASVVLVGVLRDDASLTEGGDVSLNVAVRWIGRLRSSNGRRDAAANPVEGGALLTVAGSMGPLRLGEWRAGRTIRASGVLHRPSRYLDPGVPDQERMLARRGISLAGTIKSAALVDVLAQGSWGAEAFAAARAFCRRAIQSAVGRWSARSAGIVAAIVIGDRTGLDDRVERQLQEAGTYHVIAISGGNIAILVGLTLGAFRIAGVLGPFAMISAIAGLVAYARLVGGGASVDRATLMAVVYLAGRAIDLRGAPLNTLCLVAGILIASDPLAIADPGLLLTFGATAAILMVMPAVPRHGLPRVAAPAVSLLVASAAAEAALLPVGATIFSRVTLAGLVLNFAAIPLMAVAQVAGLLVVPLFALAPGIAALAGWIAHVSAEGLVRTAGLVTFVPAVTWRVAPPSLAAMLAYYASAAATWALFRRRATAGGSDEGSISRAARRVAVVAAVMSCVWIAAGRRGIADGRLHVTFIDVGQGDAALIRFPRGATLLVDAGGLGGAGSFDIGDRVVAPVLRNAGIRRLNAMALTHGDADHVGGAQSAIVEFRPWEIWEGIPVPPFAPLRAIREEARRAGSAWRNVQIDDVSSIDDVSVIVRHPGRADWERQDVRNDDSIVLELQWRNVSFVLTGDIGSEIERQIGPRFPPAPLRVIKVPHHGSLTSSSDAFVRSLRPSVAVVSVGRSNTFGHPAAAVIRRYKESGAAVYRTDRDGAVTIDTDGLSLDVVTFTGRRQHIDAHSPDANRRS